jgi:ferredoxin-NADP reductase
VTSLVVAARAVVQATPRTRIITADLGGHQFPYRAGQAVYAGLAEGPVRRPYSIACSPRQARHAQALELLVQIDDHAPPDPHLERAIPGTALRIEGPFGAFGLPSPLVERHLLLIAGGTGIAPLRAIMWDTLERDAGTHVTVAYSARSPEEFAYLDELRSLHAAQRIELALTVTREGPLAWAGPRGRITESFVRSVLKTTDTRCLVCGPTALVQDAVALLKQAGIEDARIVQA